MPLTKISKTLLATDLLPTLIEQAEGNLASAKNRAEVAKKTKGMDFAGAKGEVRAFECALAQLKLIETDDLHQSVMDGAYARWRAHPGWDKQDFWDQLSAKERFAVFMGKMNQQITNGGFGQWLGNEHATPETVAYIRRQLNRMGTSAALKVMELVEKFDVTVLQSPKRRELDDTITEDEDEFMDRLDREYYKIDKQFLIECEEFLRQWEE
jgi:hypothetical protein